MKKKLIIISILFLVAISSSAVVLAKDGYFDKPKVENKVLSVEPFVAKPILLAQATSQVKKPVVVKKATAKKVTPKKKKVVRRKKVVNLAPPVITPATAPHSAKKR
jgi:hypothetical protein